MANGNIMEFLKSSPDACRKDLLEQVADGLHFMSEYSVVHGDLKGANILITADEKACIADFGIASVQSEIEPPSSVALDANKPKTWFHKTRIAFQEGVSSRSLASTAHSKISSSRMSSLSAAGTFRWMSPERLDPEIFDLTSAKPTLSSDVYSWAMLAYEVYAGKVPYHTEVAHMAQLSITEGRRPSRPPDVPDSVWDLIEESWRHHPTKRPKILSVYYRLAHTP